MRIGYIIVAQAARRGPLFARGGLGGGRRRVSAARGGEHQPHGGRRRCGDDARGGARFGVVGRSSRRTRAARLSVVPPRGGAVAGAAWAVGQVWWLSKHTARRARRPPPATRPSTTSTLTSFMFSGVMPSSALTSARSVLACDATSTRAPARTRGAIVSRQHASTRRRQSFTLSPRIPCSGGGALGNSGGTESTLRRHSITCGVCEKFGSSNARGAVASENRARRRERSERPSSRSTPRRTRSAATKQRALQPTRGTEVARKRKKRALEAPSRSRAPRSARARPCAGPAARRSGAR